MQLSIEHLEQVLSALRSDGQPVGVEEKRKRPRIGVRASVTVVENPSGNKGVRTTMMMRDISRGGIGLQHSRPMTTGERFLVVLPANQGIGSFLCTVRRCRLVSSGTYHIGATFIRLTDVSPKENPSQAPGRSNGEDANSPAGEAEESRKRQDSARIRKAILA